MKPDTPRAGPVTAWNRRNREATLEALRRELEQRGVILPSRWRG